MVPFRVYCFEKLVPTKGIFFMKYRSLTGYLFLPIPLIIKIYFT